MTYPLSTRERESREWQSTLDDTYERCRKSPQEFCKAVMGQLPETPLSATNQLWDLWIAGGTPLALWLEGLVVYYCEQQAYRAVDDVPPIRLAKAGAL